MKRLHNKIAVVYGDGGVGSAIAKAFAGQGAKVFLAGRTAMKLKAISDEIALNGGDIETAQLDVLDEGSLSFEQTLNTSQAVPASANSPE